MKTILKNGRMKIKEKGNGNQPLTGTAPLRIQVQND